MATIKNIYAAKTAITMTLTSLANAAAWASTVVDNTTNVYLDALLRIQTKGQASGTSTLDVYVYSALADTIYTDGASGTDGTFTAANRFNARYLCSVLLNAATSAVQFETSVAQAFGGIMPSKWGLIVVNSSGAALSATAGDHVIEFEGITQSVV